MQARIAGLWLLVAVLVGSCSPIATPTSGPTPMPTDVSPAPTEPLAPTSTPPPTSTPAPPPTATVPTLEEIIRTRANEVVLAIKSRDMERLSAFVHPTYGVRFSPYGYVRESDLVFVPDQIKDLLTDPTEYVWGIYDGVGSPVVLTFQEYYDEFVYDQDFANAEEIGYNETLGRGNTIDNSLEFYPGAIVVEYHFPGFDPAYEGMDWRSLRLVFVEKDQTWYLGGIIHDEWTI